jgi:D-glycero-alpha-D-manno-heptose-7-phosphate kinase
LSTSINKFVYLTINKRFGPGFRVSYSRKSIRSTRSNTRSFATRLSNWASTARRHGGVEITSISDIPSRGSGLGSSSAFTVGLLNALYAFLGRYRAKRDLASEACEIEIERCGEPIGKQDQYACATGGMNIITFNPDDTVDVEPVIARPEVTTQIESELLMFHTGVSRSASELLKLQSEAVAADEKKRRSLTRLVELVYALREGIVAGETNIVGDILHESWLLKKSLSCGISNALIIDDAYEAARKAGARGGKLLGAGGGGFLVFSARQEKHAAIVESLATLPYVNFRFERNGSSIVFYQPS